MNVFCIHNQYVCCYSSCMLPGLSHSVDLLVFLYVIAIHNNRTSISSTSNSVCFIEEVLYWLRDSTAIQ